MAVEPPRDSSQSAGSAPRALRRRLAGSLAAGPNAGSHGRGWVYSGIVLLGACGLLGLLPEGPPGQSPTSLLPPIAAVVWAIFSGRVTLSLLLGTVLAALLAASQPMAETAATLGFFENLSLFLVRGQADVWHLATLLFALVLLGTIQVMSFSGGIAALVNLARRSLGSARGVKLGTATAGLLLFVDDYANALVVGPAFRPLADRMGVSREKLAYLVDSTAAPVAGLALISTWVGYEAGLLQGIGEDLSLSQGGYATLLSALPYRFYCVSSLALVFLSSAFERDFGPMLRAERRAAARLVRQEALPQSSPGSTAEWPFAAVPLGLILLLLPLGLILDGGGLRFLTSAQAWLAPGELRSALTGGENNTVVLLLVSLVSLGVAVGLPWARRAAGFRGMAAAFARGVGVALPPLTVLVAAWALARGCQELNTGSYLVGLLSDSVRAEWIPLMSFGMAGLVAWLTGTSWGTMALLLPSVAPLAHRVGNPEILLITIASVLDGAIFGDHCSPLSDTTVMSAVASRCPLRSHVFTQAPYALVAMVAAAVCGYLPVSFGATPLVGYFAATLTLAVMLQLFGRRSSR